MVVRLGRAPDTLGHTIERLFLLLETSAGSNSFRPSPFLLDAVTIRIGVNDRIPVADITLAPIADSARDSTFLETQRLRDWQVAGDNATPINAWTLLGNGRKCQIRTIRAEPAEDWCLFEGFIDVLPMAWQGDNRGASTRTMRVFATSSIVAADREIGQKIAGQWRRSRNSTLALKNIIPADPPDILNECVPITAVPCVFNPRGRPNCSSTAIVMQDDTKTFIFADDDVRELTSDDTLTIPWNYARILRYLQWAAGQEMIARPANTLKPYEDRVTANVEGLSGLTWTSENLWLSTHQPVMSADPLNVGEYPNLDELVEPHILKINPAGPDAKPAFKAMLAVPEDLSVEGMTILEAFTYVADRAGLIFWVEHAMNATGLVLTYMRWAVRGDRVTEKGATPETEPAPSVPTLNPPTTGGVFTVGDLGFTPSPLEAPDFPVVMGTTRGLYWYVSSDLRDLDSATVAELFQHDIQLSGEMAFAYGDVRNSIVVKGGANQYEATVDLLPGWRPSEDWDVNNAGVTAAVAAAALVGSRELPTDWEAAYAYADILPATGRYWVLNEDLAFNHAVYARDADSVQTEYLEAAYKSPWNPGKSPMPLPAGVRPGSDIVDLRGRGAAAWTLRRRKFLPMRAKVDGREMSPIILLSFDSGTSWEVIKNGWAQIEPDRAAVYFGQEDLRQIASVEVPGENYVTAYIRGTLRVRVIANIEGDDAVLGWALPLPNEPITRPWGELIERPYDRSMRFDDAGAAAAGSDFITSSRWADAGVTVTGLNLDTIPQAARYAELIREERAVIRASAFAVVPYLLRNGDGPREGYRMGDEILGIKTGDATTFVDFLQGRSPLKPAPRIVEIVYRYSDGEHSTRYTLDDEGLLPDEAGVQA